MSRTMKDSGIPWIGEIPKDWSVMPHKRVMYKVKEIQEHYNGENILSLTMRGVIVRDLEAGGKMPTSFDGYQKVYPNNLLQCLFDIDVTPRCVGLIRNEGLSSPAYSQFAMYPNGYAPYYDYLLRYMDDRKTLLHLSKNLRSSLTETDFGAIYTCVPSSIEEQQRIAEFLDRKCAEIDEMIGLQEQIIEELKAYKQSVITEAVTKGLNPNVPMKDSGIEWIGDVPEEWEVRKIKYLSQVVRGGSPRPAGDSRYYGGNIPFMKVADITKDDKMYVDSCEFSIKEAGLSNTRMINPQTLLLTNSGATLGVPKINTFSTTFNDGIAAFLNLSKKLDLKFAYYSLKARTKFFLDSASLGIGQPNLNTDIIGSTFLTLPPLAEQQAIADYLDKKCGEIDELITIKQQKIESLKEYKKSVIYEYVTGKREV